MEPGDPIPADDAPIDPGTVVELTPEGRAMMMELLEILGDCLGEPVSGDDLSRAFRSIRQRDGIEIDISNRDHLEMLLARLAELKGLDAP